MLDNIERIIEYIKIGPRFSNSILQTLLVYITKSPINKNHKLFIIGTTNIIGRLDDLEMVSVFNHKIEIPSLKPDEIETVIEKYPDVDSSIKEKISNLYQSNEAAVPIKELIMTLDECIQVKGKGFSFSDFEEIYNLKKDETLLKY